MNSYKLKKIVNFETNSYEILRINTNSYEFVRNYLILFKEQ